LIPATCDGYNAGPFPDKKFYDCFSHTRRRTGLRDVFIFLISILSPLLYQINWHLKIVKTQKPMHIFQHLSLLNSILTSSAICRTEKTSRNKNTGRISQKQDERFKNFG